MTTNLIKLAEPPKATSNKGKISKDRLELARYSENEKIFSRLSKCSTIRDMSEEIGIAVSKLGFTHFNFRVFGMPPKKCMSTLEEKLLCKYLENPFFDSDIFVEHANLNGPPIYLSDIADHIIQSPYKSVYLSKHVSLINEFFKYGFHDSYCISNNFGNTGFKRSMMSLYKKDATKEDFRSLVENSQCEIDIVVEALNYIIFSTFPDFFTSESIFLEHPNERTKITKKSLQVLSVLAKEGIMLKNVSDKLAISVETANKHMNMIKNRLGAKTSMQAVYIATKNKLID